MSKKEIKMGPSRNGENTGHSEYNMFQRILSVQLKCKTCVREYLMIISKIEKGQITGQAIKYITYIFQWLPIWDTVISESMKDT